MQKLTIATCVAALCAGLFAQGGSVPYEDREFLQSQVLDRIKARSVGPANFGGRIIDFAVDEKNPSTYFVATASGGVFKTTNRGTTFVPVFDEQGCLSIGDIALAPSDPKVVWIGTGESNNQRSSYWGDGVYKSEDGGKTWKNTGLRGTEHIGRIVVHPRNPDIVYVAALGALYTSSKERGLYRTKDGGKSWSCVKSLGDDVGFVDVTLDHEDPNHVYAASYERRRRAWNMQNGGPGSALWKSADGGDTWTKCEGGLPGGEIGRIGVETFRSNGRVVFAVVENLNPAPPNTGTERPTIDGNGDPDTIRRDGEPRDAAPRDGRPRAERDEADADGGDEADRDADEAPQAQDRAQGSRRRIVGCEVWRSKDAGKNWTRLGAAGGNPNYYYGQIRVDPADDNRIYVLGVEIQHTEDGGKKWLPEPRPCTPAGPPGGRRGGAAPRSLGSGLHVDHHALWIDPKDSQHMLLGNDGGFAETYDAGKSWDYLNDLALGQFYAVAVDTRQPYWIYGGTQDNGTWGIPTRGATTGGLTRADARKINGGDGFCVAVDPEDANIVYSESQFGAVSRQDLRTGARKSIKPSADRGMPALRFNWMTPILISPHDRETVYVCSQLVHRSKSRGDRWETISGDLTTADPDKLKGNVPHCTITTIDESPQRAGHLLVGTDDGRVWLTKNGGGHWEELSKRFPGLPMPLWVSRVHWSPSEASVGYVTFTGYREDHRKPYLFLTTDGGDTWRSIVNDLPESPINVVREHPRNKNVLFVGHESGLCVSIDGGASWQRLSGGMPRVAVHDLVVHPREMDLVVGTHGRGLYVLDIAALEDADAGLTTRAISLVPPRDGWQLRGGVNRGFRGARNWTARNPELNPVLRYVLGAEADTAVKVEVLDAAEKVLYTASGSAKPGLQEVLWRFGGGGGPFGRGGGEGRGGAESRAGGPGGGPSSRPSAETARIGAGQYRLRITLGETRLERSFRISAAPDWAQGGGFGPEEEDEDEPDSEEQAERAAEGEARFPDR